MTVDVPRLDPRHWTIYGPADPNFILDLIEVKIFQCAKFEDKWDIILHFMRVKSRYQKFWDEMPHIYYRSHADESTELLQIK